MGVLGELLYFKGDYSGRAASRPDGVSVINPLHKPLLSVKVKIDSIDHGFGIRNCLERACLVYAAGTFY